MSEHGVEHIDASSSEADEGGVVFLALGSFAVVGGPAGGVVQCRERSQEECPFEVLVAGSTGVLAADAGAGWAGDGGESGPTRATFR